MRWLVAALPYIIPAIWIIGGVIAGFVLDRIVLARLQTSSFFAKHYWLNIVLGAARAGAIILCTVIGIYLALLSSHLDPRIEEALDKVLSILLLAWATFFAARLAGGAVSHFGHGHEKQVLSPSLFATIAQVAVFVMGALIVLSSLGIQITPLLTALGVGGLAVALALKDTLSNLFSGIQIIASRQVRPGDYIQMENSYEGYVEDINWRNTTIREGRNNLVVIPNEKLAQSVFTNYRLPESEMFAELSVGVDSDSDLERVERVATTVANDVRKEIGWNHTRREPVVRFRSFAGTGIEAVVQIPVPALSEGDRARHLLINQLHERFRVEGIRLAGAPPVVNVNGAEPPAESKQPAKHRAKRSEKGEVTSDAAFVEEAEPPPG